MTSSNSDKNVPTVNNVASEKAVLSGMIRYGYDAFLDVSGLVEEQTFTIDENKVVYKCLSKIFETSQNVDLTSILSAAQQLDLSEFIEKKDALNHIKHLMHYDVHVDNIRQPRMHGAGNLGPGIGYFLSEVESIISGILCQPLFHDDLKHGNLQQNQ